MPLFSKSKGLNDLLTPGKKEINTAASRLPLETIFLIFQFMADSPKSVASLERINKKIYSITNAPENYDSEMNLWKIAAQHTIKLPSGVSFPNKNAYKLALLGAKHLPKNLRIVIMGLDQSGKSVLTIKYITDKFELVYDPTIEDSYRKSVEIIPGRTTMLEILDTAGQEEFSALRPAWISSADSFIFCISADNAKGIEGLKLLMKDVSTSRKDADLSATPVVVAVTKTDLKEQTVVNATTVSEHVKKWGFKGTVVNPEEGEGTLLAAGGIPILSTSSKENVNVKDAFQLAVIQHIKVSVAQKHGSTKACICQ